MQCQPARHCHHHLFYNFPNSLKNVDNGADNDEYNNYCGDGCNKNAYYSNDDQSFKNSKE